MRLFTGGVYGWSSARLANDTDECMVLEEFANSCFYFLPVIRSIDNIRPNFLELSLLRWVYPDCSSDRINNRLSHAFSRVIAKQGVPMVLVNLVRAAFVFTLPVACNCVLPLLEIIQAIHPHKVIYFKIIPSVGYRVCGISRGRLRLVLPD